MIKVSGLSKSYGSNLAVDNISFEVKRGDVVGFLGPNGAGKSTTMKILTGFMACTSGKVEIDGLDIYEHPIEVKKKIGYLPETPPLYLDMRVRDYLSFVADIKGVEKGKKNKQILEALEKVNIGDIQKRLIGNLSKGYKQRVGLAQALVSDPEILILDEPTVGLDPNQVKEIRELINGLKESHHTVLLSTHILSEVQATCEKIIIIDKGRIVAKDSLDGLNQSMEGTRQVVFKVRRPEISFEDKVRTLDGVKGIRSRGIGEFEVDIEKNDDVQEELSALVAQSGAGLMEYQPHSKSLEDIFLQLTKDSPIDIQPNAEVRR